jgi:hypothetical protein
MVMVLPGLTRVAEIGSLASRVLLAGVFGVSAIGKIISPSSFYAFARGLGWIAIIPTVALLVVIVGLELVLALALLFRKTSHLAIAGSFVVLVLFTAVLMYASHSEGTVASTCGCFGELLPAGTLDASILRNLVLLALCAVTLMGKEAR